jgi:hypothetical protein
MIIHKMSSNESVAFVRNPNTDYHDVLRELGYVKKDGNPYKYVNINHSGTYRFDGGDNVSSVEIEAKGVKTHVVTNRVETTYTGNDTSGLAKFLNTFGKSTKISFNGSSNINGGFFAVDKMLKNSSGDLISIGSFNKSSDVTPIHQFIQRMGNDGGRVLFPLIKKFSDTARSVKLHNNQLTGYANLASYLNILRIPSKGILDKSTPSINADYAINVNRLPLLIEVFVSASVEGTIHLDVTLNGTFGSAAEYSGPNPYILVTTKPTSLGGDRLPYQLVKYSGIPYFISPLLFTSDKYLHGLRGGINLLK